LKRYLYTLRLSFLLLLIISVTVCKSSNRKQDNKENIEFLTSKVYLSADSVSKTVKYNLAVPTRTNGSFPYDLEDPDEKYLLPEYLEEISGLAYYEDDKILCVQDEKANIYVFNLAEKEIENKFIFGKDGDYEDIAVAGQTAYVVRSDGHIFRIENLHQKNREVIVYKTPLSKKNDTEGITYDKLSNSLLIACKGSPSVEHENPYKGYKAIYRFDLGEMKLNKEPYFLVDLNRPDNYKDYNLFKEFSLQVARKLQFSERAADFHPSGLAIHPLYNEIYLISDIGKILIILDRDGRVLDLHGLDSKILRQPEGICFSPSGDMFIANEGKAGHGYILKFNLQSEE